MMNFKYFLTLTLLIVISQTIISQNVGINATGVNPDNSAMLDIVSSDKGILIPRVSIAVLTTAAPITAPVNSLLVFNTNAATGEGYYYWDNANTTWVKLLDSNSNSDEDWHKATTTTSPTSINDDIFTNGNVGIGLNNPSEPLEVIGRVKADSYEGVGNNGGGAGGNAIIKKNATANRDELQIYSGGDAYQANSKGAGIHLYGNFDSQHAGNVAFLTGDAGDGDARMIISGGDGPLNRNLTDTRITIGNNIWNWVDNSNDIGMLNLKNPKNVPAIYAEAATTNEGLISVRYADSLTFGHWDGTTFIPRVIIDNTGKMGIGLINPTQALEIESGNIELDSDYGVGYKNGSATNEYKFYPHRSGFNAFTGLGPVTPYTNGMTLESDALIGFVETDGNKLSGFMDLNADEFIWDGKIGVGTENPGAQITVKGDARIRLDNNINYQWDLNVDNTDSKFAIESFSNLTSKGNRFVIDTMGKVGIGISAPTARLEVKHNVNEFAVRIFNTQSAGGNGLLLESNGGDQDDTLFLIRSDLDLSSGSRNEDFIVLAGGRTGIAHTNPNTQTKLDVNGYMIGQNFLFSAFSSNKVSNFGNGVVSFAEENDPHNDYAANAYTAPIDGYYFFSTEITFVDGNGVDDTFVLNFLKNGAVYNSININPHFLSTGSGEEVNYSSTAVIPLTAGQTVSVSLTSVDTAIVDYVKRKFMGYMISK